MSVVLASCTQVRPGVKTVNGAVVQNVAQAPEEVMRAAEETFMEMGYIVATEKTNSVKTRITAHNAQGTRFTVEARRKTPTLTEYTVRIDPGQNENASRIIIEKINERL
jgi:hypothetical protein